MEILPDPSIQAPTDPGDLLSEIYAWRELWLAVKGKPDPILEREARKCMANLNFLLEAFFVIK